MEWFSGVPQGNSFLTSLQTKPTKDVTKKYIFWIVPMSFPDPQMIFVNSQLFNDNIFLKFLENYDWHEWYSNTYQGQYIYYQKFFFIVCLLSEFAGIAIFKYILKLQKKNQTIQNN